ncbi:ATP-binding protein [Streptomyces sp. SRF1]|uniref:ATP-binding protein n=1 Tax=Streptomyces sp. SRF1 TaxID=1549642 RepID=UPI0025B1BD45|nr:ATP-binding protein [Streptomyces sp. SRF1]MDN3057471.1 ATP-binding protein [Streptomyces sp. SRF1]
MDQPERFVVSCARTPQQVARLRRLGAAHLRLWGLRDCVETAKLLISELVTNAVRYGEADEIGFSLSCWRGELRIEVSDGSPGHPTVKRPNPGEECGRGMLIIDALAKNWGTSLDGTRTWCTIAAPNPIAMSPGIWCEWRSGDGTRLASNALPSPDAAIHWARVQGRVVAVAIGVPAVGYFWDLLSDAWREPAEALKRGEAFTLRMTAGPYTFVWHARPAVFLPVVEGTSSPHHPQGAVVLPPPHAH